MKPKLIIPSLAFFLALLACSFQINTTNPPPVSITDTLVPSSTVTGMPTLPSLSPSPLPPSSPELSLDSLRNATYYAPFYGRTVTLVNGSYSEGSGATKDY